MTSADGITWISRTSAVNNEAQGREGQDAGQVELALDVGDEKDEGRRGVDTLEDPAW